MKKTLSLLLVICMLVTMFGVPVTAAEPTVPGTRQLQKEADVSLDRQVPQEQEKPIMYGERSIGAQNDASENSIEKMDTNLPPIHEVKESQIMDKTLDNNQLQIINKLHTYDKQSVDSKQIRTLEAPSNITVSIDKPIIRVGENTPVTITVHSNGMPVSNQSVSIDGKGYGLTGEDGTIICDINPSNHGNLELQIGDNYYSSDSLFAIYDDEGVVEVHGLAANGEAMGYFNASVRSTQMWYGSGSSGKIARTIAKQGPNTLVISCPYGNDGYSYYIMKEISVTAGINNEFVVNGSENTIPVDLYFAIDNQVAPGAEYYLSRIDGPFAYRNDYLGYEYGAGVKQMYITPGMYSFNSANKNAENELVYLSKNYVPMFMPGPYDISFTTAGTGKINFNLQGIDSSSTQVSVRLNNMDIPLRNSSVLVLEPNNYYINHFSANGTFANSWTHYEFHKLDNDADVLPVSAGSVTDYTIDINMNETILRLYNTTLKTGQYLNYRLIPITYSGYSLEYINDNSTMDVIIEKPNQQTEVLQQNFNGASYYIDANAPEGRYKMNAAMKLGPLYNDAVIQADAYFDVIGSRELSVDKPVIIIGQETPIKLTLTSNGNPVPDEDVHIQGQYYGKTDGNGELTIVINAQQKGNLEIKTGSNNYFYDTLYAVNPDEGVVEVTLKDHTSKPVLDFHISARSQNMWWGGSSSNGIVRTLAKEGLNTLQVISRGSNYGDVYYLMEDIAVTPGVINNYALDAAQSTVEARISVLLDGVRNNNADIYINKTDTPYVYFESFAGSLDSNGLKRLYVTPGIYSISQRSVNANNEMLYLKKSNLSFTANGDYPIEYNTANTGRVHFDFAEFAPASARKTVYLDDNYLYLGDTDTVILEAKTYKVNSLRVEMDDHGQWLNYEFRKLNNFLDTVTVTADSPSHYGADLHISSFDINIRSNNINPDRMVYYEALPVTNSGYYINHMTNYNNMDVIVEKPDQTTDAMRQDYRNASYYVRPDDPEGTYKINAALDLGPLYNHQICTATGSFEVVGKREVTVDNPVLKLGQDNTVTITVTSNGIPVPNEDIFVAGVYYGKTDSNGELVAVINTNIRGSLEIRLGNDTIHNNLLFGVNPDEGVVEVTLQDVSGKDLEYFHMTARSPKMWWGTGASGKVARTIAKEGANTLLVASEGSNQAEGYFIMKDITVARGAVNSYHLDGASETIKADVSFLLDNAAVSNTALYVNKLDGPFVFDYEYMGYFDFSGKKVVYMTPGMYDMAIRNINNYDEILYLEKKDISVYASGSYPMQFSASNTGKVHVDFGSNLHEDLRKSIILNGSYIYLGTRDTLILEQGSHVIDFLNLEIDHGGRWINYEFWKSGDTRDIINIVPGEVQPYTANLAMKETQLKVYRNNVYPDSWVDFELVPVTESGYRITYIRNHNLMDVVINKPDGSTINSRQDYRNGHYYVEPNDPAGTYEINAHLFLGPLYGTGCQATGTFNVIGKREIHLNQPIIVVGEPSEVVLLVTSNGMPVPNEKVRIGTYAHGVTDPNGFFVTTIQPEYSDAIEIQVGEDIYFNDELFALFPDQGVVEVTANDISGYALKDFYLNASSQNSSWGTYSGDHVGRVIATQGENQILVTYTRGSDQDSYYMLYDITVVPSIMNYVSFDSAQDTVTADLSFSIDGQMTNEAEVRISSLSRKYFSRLNYVGYTNNHGLRRIHLTPGNYDIRIAKAEKDITLFLDKSNEALLSSGNYSIDFSTANTGKVTFDFGSNIPSTAEKSVYLNGQQTDLRGCNSMMLQANSYTLTDIRIAYFDNSGRHTTYYYRKPYHQDTLNVLAGTTISYNADLNMKDISLKIYGDNISKDHNIHFAVEAATNSGYHLNYVNGYNLMNVLITRPDGSTTSFLSDFKNAWYHVGSDDPEGVYTIEVNGDLGPLFAPYHLIGSFTVVGGANIKVVGTEPANGSIDVPVDIPVTIQFDQPIQLGSRQGEIALRSISGAVVPIDLQLSDSSLTIIPMVKLEYGITYEVILPVHSVVGHNGETLTADFVLGFSTMTDKISPVVVGTTPQDGAMDVSIGSPISIQYDEDITFVVTASRRGTPTPKVTLQSADGQLVPITYSNHGNVLVIAPQAALREGVKYTVTVPAGIIADVNKNTVRSTYSFSFTTKAATLNKIPRKR